VSALKRWTKAVHPIEFRTKVDIETYPYEGSTRTDACHEANPDYVTDTHALKQDISARKTHPVVKMTSPVDRGDMLTDTFDSRTE
jgi:hypothetical protein